MYPQTYFLVSLLIGVILSKFGLLSMQQAFLAAVLAVLIDLDHFLSILWKRSSALCQAWGNALAHHGEAPFFHTTKGFFLLLAVKAAVLLYNRPLALLLAVAYWSHLFLDTLHQLLQRTAAQHLARFHLQATIAELTVQVFSLLMIVLYLQFA